MLFLFLYFQFRLIRYCSSLLLLSLCISKYLLHFSLLRSTSNRRISYFRFEDYYKLSLSNLVLALEIRKRLELYSCCSQIFSTSNKVTRSSVASYILTTNIEIDFQILRLSKREIGAFEQKIILVEQIIYFVNFDLYRDSKLLFFDKPYYLY